MEDWRIPSAMLVVVVFYILVGQYLKAKNVTNDIEWRIHLINESSFGIIAGMIVGALYKAASPDNYHSLRKFRIDPHIFFNFLLPIIIFAGGYNLKKKRFLQNFKYIVVFGFTSTLVNFLLVFSLTMAVNEIGLASVEEEDRVVKLTDVQMLMYSATICATDSVASLTLLDSDRFPKLFSVVFGEGMVNDAVSIILFKAITEISMERGFVWYVPFELIGRFLKNCLLSLLVGMAVGLVSTLIFKKAQYLTKSTVAETLLAFLMAFSGYNLCEMLNLSGVIGLLMIGIIMSHYQTYNMSNLGKVTTRVTFDSMSLMCEAFIYVYLGFAIWDQTYITTENQRATISWQFTVSQVLIVMVARMLSVYFVYFLTVLIQGQRAWKLKHNELAITCFAGMIRGSVAFALIETLKADPSNATEYHQVKLIQSTVLFIVAGTTVCFGTAMPLFINYHLKHSEAEEQLVKEQVKAQSDAQRIIKYLDDNYFKQWFIFDYENRKHIINSYKKDIKKRDLQDIFDDAISDKSDDESELQKFRIEVDETEIRSAKNIPLPEVWERMPQ